ncbi:putative selenate ABC transporter substrate-binding protein [Blastococcus sp. VKM Ac-2987]|uniref:putative selenate ABC transporter substrate-binding protein n=1 Tax=Blastococcus sp. VKM Ac-2987 TaxID=3004141 RepID=UPI0022ABADA7|nr:putative selenate ABC transporter substrate-binding protein [Blastococcus sp. VKM Ac-2987]MCZ2857347.1 putative selenate ABC transporter substrate-binding protein [Blastococcus sp. VKM Ac-2987]
MRGPAAARSGGLDPGSAPLPLLRRIAALLLVAVLAGCGSTSPAAGSTDDPGPLRIGAIPDQDPEVLQRLHGTVADSLSTALDLDVEYVPVTDYAAAVSLFRTGDLDLVWFGGLTGVQARLQTPGAVPIAQRDIDEDFHSVFVVNAGTGLAPSDDLTPLGDLRFTYGSETSTSGRLMPAYFLAEQGVDPEGFPGGPGFSGSHDATLSLVASGSYQAGVLNEQVYESRAAAGEIDPAVVRYARTPAYHDYHWLLGPRAVERFGADLPDRLTGYFTGLSADVPADAEVLELFGAGSFVPTEAANYDQIEQIGRDLGLVN